MLKLLLLIVSGVATCLPTQSVIQSCSSNERATEAEAEISTMLLQTGMQHLEMGNVHIQEKSSAASATTHSERHSQKVQLQTGRLEFGTLSQEIAYCATYCVIGLFITFAYWPRGAFKIIMIVAYLWIGSVITSSVKWVFIDSGWEHPKDLTVFHMAFSAAVGFSIMLYKRHYKGEPIKVPTKDEFVWKLLPLSLAFTYSLGCANTALLYCTVAFNAIIGSATPACSVLVLWAMGMKFNYWLLVPVAGVVIGCMASVAGEVRTSWMGLMLTVFANFGRALKAVLQQKLLTGEDKQKFDPITLLFWMSLLCSGEMLAYCMCIEGLPGFAALLHTPSKVRVFALIAQSCVIAALQNLFHIYVVADLGAVGIQVTAQVKIALSAFGGIIFFGDHLTVLSASGGALILCSAFVYARWDEMLKKATLKDSAPRLAAAGEQILAKAELPKAGGEHAKPCQDLKASEEDAKHPCQEKD